MKTKILYLTFILAIFVPVVAHADKLQDIEGVGGLQPPAPTADQSASDNNNADDTKKSDSSANASDSNAKANKYVFGFMPNLTVTPSQSNPGSYDKLKGLDIVRGGYRNEQQVIEGAATAQDQNWLEGQVRLRNIGKSLLCSPDGSFCGRLDGDLNAQGGIGRGTYLLDASINGGVVYRYVDGDTTYGAGASGRFMAQTTNVFNADSSNNSNAGIGLGGFLYIDSNSFNAMLSGDAMLDNFAYDPTNNPVAGIYHADGRMGYKAFKNKKSGRYFEFYADSSVIGQSMRPKDGAVQNGDFNYGGSSNVNRVAVQVGLGVAVHTK